LPDGTSDILCDTLFRLCAGTGEADLTGESDGSA
jgi:hypothetical protein